MAITKVHPVPSPVTIPEDKPLVADAKASATPRSPGKGDPDRPSARGRWASSTVGSQSRGVVMPPGRPRASLVRAFALEKRSNEDGPAQDLWQAAEAGDTAAFRGFMAAGQSLKDKVGVYRQTAAHVAAYANSVPVLQAIVETITDPTELTTLFLTKDWLHMTVVHMACITGNVQTLLYLIGLERAERFTAEVFSARDIWGKTPLDWAVAQGHADTAELLVLRKLDLLLPVEQDVADLPDVLDARMLIAQAQESLDRNDKQVAKRRHSDGGSDDIHKVDNEDIDEDLDDDVALDASMIWAVVRAGQSGNLNILSVLLRIESLLTEAGFFEELALHTQQLVKLLMDTCKSKEQAKAVLSPLKDECRAPKQPQEAIMYALEVGNKKLIAHKHVQALLTEKFDPVGNYQYSSNIITFSFWLASAALMFLIWVLLVPWILLLRPFSDWLMKFTTQGQGKADNRRPWQMPYNMWLASYITLLCFVVGMTILVMRESQNEEYLLWLEMIMQTWALGTLVDEVQEFMEFGLDSYLQDTFNTFDVLASVCYTAYFVCRVCYVYRGDWNDLSPEGELRLLANANDVLAVAVFCMYIRLLGVFEISPTMGPLLVSLRRMITNDVFRFLILLVVTLFAFGFALVAVFKPVCTDDGCREYDQDWPTDWQNDGLTGALSFLEFQLLGLGSAVPWSQKPVSGLLFYSIFTTITSIILLNLFIAMMSDTYSTVRQQSADEYKFVRASLIFKFSSREAIYPPLNLLHLAAGLIGNTVRRAIWGQGNFIPVRLSRDREDHAHAFSWYYPDPPMSHNFWDTRCRIFRLFVRINTPNEQEAKVNKRLKSLRKHSSAAAPGVVPFSVGKFLSEARR